MYRVIKEKGNNQNITLENIETKANIIIGKLTMDIMRVLEKEIEFDETKEGSVRYRDKWDFKISDELGKELAKTTMPMKKPIRHQEKKPATKSEQMIKHKTKSGKEAVDVFDLIFGTN